MLEGSEIENVVEETIVTTEETEETNRMNMIFIIAVIEIVLKYGIPAAMKIIADWAKQNPTIADLEELRERVKKPEEYFLP